MERQSISDIQAKELLATGDGVIVNAGKLERLIANRDDLREQLAAATEAHENVRELFAASQRAELQLASDLQAATARAEKAEAAVSAVHGGDLTEAYAAGEQKIIGLLGVANTRVSALRARVAELEGALKQIQGHACPLGTDSGHLGILKIAENVLLRQPAQSLAAIKAEALSEVADELIDLTKEGASTYVVAYRTGVVECFQLVKSKAQRLEKEVTICDGKGD